MAAEAQRAPRVASERTSMAAAAAAMTTALDPHVQAISTLNSFQLTHCHPFDTSAADLCHSANQQAHALLVTLALSIDELASRGEGELPLRPCHIAKALDGIATLIALSAVADLAVGAGS